MISHLFSERPILIFYVYRGKQEMTFKKARRMRNCTERGCSCPFENRQRPSLLGNLKHGKSRDFRNEFSKTSTWRGCLSIICPYIRHFLRKVLTAFEYFVLIGMNWERIQRILLS
jgi:hypothetical protein